MGFLMRVSRGRNGGRNSDITGTVFSGIFGGCGVSSNISTVAGVSRRLVYGCVE